jgi:hypothetical protein
MPFARSVHGRGVNLDKAAVLSYCKLKSITGDYVTCECVFTVVYSVIVASTSLYTRSNKSLGLSSRIGSLKIYIFNIRSVQ